MQNKKTLDIAIEFKALEGAEPLGSFDGYGAVFGNIDSHRDVIRPGAFSKSLKERTPVMVYQHNLDQPIGVYTEVREDGNGLYVKGQLCLDTQVGREAYALMKMGALKGLSIGYIVVNEDYDSKTNISYLNEIDLYEISLVTIPSNELSHVQSVKSDEETINLPEVEVTERMVEKALRDVGLSQREAKTVISKGFKALKRDVVSEESNLSNVLSELERLNDSIRKS